MQQVIIMETVRPDMGAKATGWTAEDPTIYRSDTTRISFAYTFGTPLEALAMGWRLLAPPSRTGVFGFYEWWFVREV